MSGKEPLIGSSGVVSHMKVEDGLYVVGCFERRITLLSQQVRALNLVFSLRKQGLLKEGDSIAVIGGGVAGLTAAAGAARLGCKVTLFERADSLLHLFRGNHTRWLHPNVYDWPSPEATNEDAGLPLLNWRAGLADGVVRQIEEGWNALPERGAIEVVYGAEITDLGSGTPRRLTWNAPGHRSGKFALAILAVGFGLERRIPGIPPLSYWDNDNLHQASRTGGKRYLISGTGDGGLVDLLRVRLRDFQHDQVLATFLASPALKPVAERLLDIEEDARTEEGRRAGSSREVLYDAYSVLDVPEEVDKVIEARLRTDGTKVVLNGLDASPYTLGAAILSRFLASRLLVRFGVPYRPGKFSEPKKVGDAFEVQFATGAPVTFDVIVGRHGPEPALKEGFPAIWTKCADRMRVLSELDQTRRPIYGETFKREPGGGSAPDGGSGTSNSEPRAEDGAEALKSAGRTPHNLRKRNSDFRGRGEVIATLEKALRDGERTTITHASVFGLGGVGKTAVALELAHRAVERGDYPGGVWWVHAEGKPIDALVNLAPVLRMHGPAEVQKSIPEDEKSAKRIADAVRLALQGQRSRSLLILDNVSERGWGPHVPAGDVRVLATTRDEGLALGTARRLDVLSPAEAREVAETIAGAVRRERELEALQRVLVTELGGLAVAVEMAARAVKRMYGGSWVTYEKVLREGMDRELADPRLVSADYGRGVFAALDLSLDRCNANAWSLLEGVAVFGAEAVPLEWAIKAAGLKVEGAAARAKAMLKELGLATIDEKAGEVSVHRLVRRQVRRRAEAERVESWREASLRGADVAVRWISGAVNDNPTRVQMEAVDTRREHLEQALEAAERANNQGAWSMIADRLARHLRNRARYAEALPLFQQALAKDEQLVPPKPLYVAAGLSNLAMVLHDLGDAAGARPLLERALGIYEETCGPQHPDVATALSNLATVLKDLDDAAEARPLLERALNINETTFGPQHPTVAISLSNLGPVLRVLGDAAGARPLLERALDIDEKTFGREHPTVAIRLSNLAMVLQALGDPAGARPLLERALDIDEKTFGREHPTVAIRMSNLATVLHDLGDGAGARPLLERALAIVRARLPPGHRYQRLIWNNLASLDRPRTPPPAGRGSP
jgi:tetratricopeptide (TPR) repeat protein